MLRDESGFTLPELLLAMVIFSIVLLATLGVFDQSSSLSARNAKQNDSVEESRVAVDQVIRQLRNLASPSSPQSTIDTASGYDLIFQTDDPSKTWVRYCLKTTGSGATATGTLYYGYSASQTLTAAQKSSPCPGSGWGSNLKVVAQDVSNQASGQDRPVFAYTCTAGSPSGCPASSADNSKIVLTGVTLYIDTSPGQLPAEKRITSGVYLRNQNQAPSASYTYTNQPVTPHTLIFNGSASSDPEGRTLHYAWCVGSTAPCTTDSSFYVGTGVTFTYTFPQTGTQTVTLTVTDPGGLTSTYPPAGSPIPVVVP
jgi:prepilin-type N-terminal cleavage/methylation domain-containing protein